VLGFPLFFILPFLVGCVLPNIFYKGQNFITKILISWFFGLFIIVFLSITLENLAFLNIYILNAVLIAICTMNVATNVIFNRTTFWLPIIEKSTHFDYRKLLPLSVIILISIAFTCILLWNSPFPTTFAGDEFEFTLGAFKIIDSGLLPQLGAYFPYVPLLQAVSSVFYNVHPIVFVWSGTFFLYALFSIGVYFLALEINYRPSVAVLSALFAASAFFIKTINLARLVPMSFVYVVFPIVLLLAYRALKQTVPTSKFGLKFFFVVSPVILAFIVISPSLLSTLNYAPVTRIVALAAIFVTIFVSLRLVFSNSTSLQLSVAFLSVLFLHQDLALIADLLIYGLMLLYVVKSFYSRYFYRAIIVMLLLLFTFFVISNFASFSFLSQFFSTSYFGIDSIQKLVLLGYCYYVLPLIAVIAVVYYLLERKIDYLPFALLFLAVLLIYFIPASLSIRSMVFLTPFFAFFTADFIGQIFNFKPKRQTKFKLNKILCVILSIIIISMIFVPISNYLSDLNDVGKNTSSYTRDELTAAIWVRENVPNALIISDPMTQTIISGLSGTQNLGQQYMGGSCRNLVQTVLKTDDAKEAHDSIDFILSQNITTNYSKISATDVFQRDAIAQMRGNRFDLNLTTRVALVILTARTINWSKSNDLWGSVVTDSYLWANMFPSVTEINMTDPSVTKFFNNAYFGHIYNSSSVYIFQLQNAKLDIAKIETAPVTIYDDGAIGLWTVNRIGDGTCDYLITSDTSNKISKKTSLSLNVTSGTYDHLDLRLTLNSPQDFSQKYLNVYIYGANDHRLINIYLLTPDWSNTGSYALIDDWSGWAYFKFSIDGAQASGSYDASNIAALYFENIANNNTIWIDRISVSS